MSEEPRRDGPTELVEGADGAVHASTAADGVWEPSAMVRGDVDANRLVAAHHPFTSPRSVDEDKLESAPGDVLARAYDLDGVRGAPARLGADQHREHPGQEALQRLFVVDPEEQA